MAPRTAIARFFLWVGLCLVANASTAQDLRAYEPHRFNAPELNMAYRLLRPLKADTQQVYPLLIFLHGARQKGFDNNAQLSIGAAYFLQDSIRERYPAYVLFPQCPELDLWAYFEVVPDSAGHKDRVNFPFKKHPTEVTGVLMRLVDSLLALRLIDPDRIYVAGISQGGMGVLDLLARYPKVFAAGISMCGAGKASTTKNFAATSALWLFHGSADDVIPVDYSRDYFKRLQKLGADVRYTEYEGVGHNCWEQAFQEPELMAWLFWKRRRVKNKSWELGLGGTGVPID
jgi:predicted peptidase